AAAESRVQDPEREPARVRTSEALDAEHHVDLLEVTSRLDQARGGLARPVGTPTGYGLSCAVEEALTREGPPDQPDEAGVVDTAGHRDHHPLGAVVAAVEPAYLLAAHALDRRHGAGDGTAQRRVTPGQRREQVVCDIVGVV